MKPETGNNSLAAQTEKVSVRIESGGHSFSSDTLPPKVLQAAEAEFCVVTDKTVLVPDEAFDPEYAERWLAVSGLACNDDELPLCVSRNGVTAIMAVARQCSAAIGREFGQRAHFTTPLLEEYDSEGRKLHIRTIGQVSYFKLYENGRLRFAEALKTEGPGDILYYMHKIDGRFGLDAYHIYIYGEGAAGTRKVLKKYFNRVKCE